MISITLGGGAEFTIDEKNRLWIRQFVRGHLTYQIELGPATEKRFDEIIDHLNKLRVHCVPSNLEG